MNRTGNEFAGVVKTARGLLDRLEPRINWTVVVGFGLLMAVGSVLMQQGGTLHWETLVYLPGYWSGRPLVALLYDSNTFDMGCYQARELSYLTDYLDANFIKLCILQGYPHFLQLSHFLFSILIGVILWRFCTKDLTLKPSLSLLLVLLYWASPSVFLGGNFFRSSKIGVALIVAMLFVLVFRLLRSDLSRPDYRLPVSGWLACTGLSVLGSLYDRQGLFLIGMIIAFLVIWRTAFPAKNVIKLIAAFSLGLFISQAYNYWIAPELTFHA